MGTPPSSEQIANTAETSLYDEYAQEQQQRQRLTSQLDHIVQALQLDEQLDVPASLGVPAESCEGEALWQAIAYQPLILTRLSRMILGVLDSYLNAADVQSYLNEQGRVRARDLSIVTDALTESQMASPRASIIH